MVYTDDGRFVESKTIQGLTSSYTYDLTRGLMTSATAPSGLTTRYFYDALGRQYKTQSPLGVESYTTLNWVPSGDDDSPDDALYYSYSQTSGIAPEKTYYNKNGQLRRTVSVGFNSDSIIYTDRHYYADGRLEKESLPYYSNTEEADVQWNKYYYDEPKYNRLSKVEYADGSEMHKDYIDAERKVATTVTNTVDGVTKTQSDTVMSNALGQTIASTDNMDNTVTYSYDAAGRLKNSYVDANYVTSFKYDLLGNRTQIDDPDAGIITSNYNAFGQLMSSKNARNQTISYLYDALGRVCQEETKDATSHSFDKLEYDYITSGAAIGQLNWVKQNNILAEEYSYDNMGRMNGKTEYIEGHATPFTHSHTYDDYGRIATQTYPGGYKLIHKYTANGDLDYISQDDGSQVSKIYENTAFNALGALTKYKLGNGNYTFDREYDAYGKLERLNSDFQDLNYDFGPMGNLKSRIDGNSGMEEHFGYDDLNRLTDIELHDLSGHLSEYDKGLQFHDNGNILSKTDVGADMVYGENAGPHALTSINTPMGYQPPKQHIDYTYFNKAELINQGEQHNGIYDYSYQYTYGADRQRRKTVYSTYNSTTGAAEVIRTKYYLGNYEKVIENGVTKEYHYLSADAGLFGIFVKTNGVGELKYTLTDHLGSLTGVVDATTGDVEYEVSFDAWGQPRSTDWKSDYSGSLMADRGFTGHEHLPAAFGLIDMNGRMYDPVVGRFLSPDPYVQAPDYAQNFNRYAYCYNNPLVYTDPDGEWIGIAIAAAIIIGKNYYDGYKANDKEANPFNWDWSNAYFHIGNSTSLDGSSTSFSLGMGWSPDAIPTVGYSTDNGMGAGYYSSYSGEQMYYPNQVAQQNYNDQVVSDKVDGFVNMYGGDYVAKSNGVDGHTCAASLSNPSGAGYSYGATLAIAYPFNSQKHNGKTRGGILLSFGQFNGDLNSSGMFFTIGKGEGVMLNFSYDLTFYSTSNLYDLGGQGTMAEGGGWVLGYGRSSNGFPLSDGSYSNPTYQAHTVSLGGGLPVSGAVWDTKTYTIPWFRTHMVGLLLMPH